MALTIDGDPDDVAITKLRNGYKAQPGEVVIEHAPLGDGSHRVPLRYDLVNTGAGDEPSWRMAFAVRDGVPRCIRITFEMDRPGQEVRSTHLRDLRVEDMIELATRFVAVPVKFDENGAEREVPISLKAVRAGVTLPAVRAARKIARRKITDDLLREVADVYRKHAGRRPTKAVQDHFNLTAERTARDWVNRARRTGYLGKSIRGKPGEH